VNYLYLRAIPRIGVPSAARSSVINGPTHLDDLIDHLHALMGPAETFEDTADALLKVQCAKMHATKAAFRSQTPTGFDGEFNSIIFHLLIVVL
jgi:hypothetical protein